MNLKISNCADENISKMEIGQAIMADGEVNFGFSASILLQNDIIAQKSIVAHDEKRGAVVGALIVDECQTYIDILLAYVVKGYRKKGVFRAMLDKLKQYAKEQMKPIKLYCNKELSEAYSHCEFKKSDNLEVMVYENIFDSADLNFMTRQP